VFTCNNDVRHEYVIVVIIHILATGLTVMHRKQKGYICERKRLKKSLAINKRDRFIQVWNAAPLVAGLKRNGHFITWVGSALKVS